MVKHKLGESQNNMIMRINSILVLIIALSGVYLLYKTPLGEYFAKLKTFFYILFFILGISGLLGIIGL